METKTIFVLYLFNEMIPPFHFSSTMLCKTVLNFLVLLSLLSYDIDVLFKINNILPLWVTFYTLI